MKNSPLQKDKVILTIAGSDPVGGAGIQADLKTIESLGGICFTVITAITAQNNSTFLAAESVSPRMLKYQLDSVLAEAKPDAVKIGMIYSEENLEIICEYIVQCKLENIVFDPVLYSSSGGALAENHMVQKIMKKLMPLCSIITPNIPECEIFSEMKVNTRVELEAAIKKIYQLTGTSMVVKGGHALFEKETSTDLFYGGEKITSLSEERATGAGLRGTGCTFSSALACYLTICSSKVEAVSFAKKYITQAITTSNKNSKINYLNYQSNVN